MEGSELLQVLTHVRLLQVLQERLNIFLMGWLLGKGDRLDAIRAGYLGEVLVIGDIEELNALL